MATTNLVENRILDQQFGAVAPTIPSNYYIALSTTTPTDAGSNFNEPTVTSTGYARVTVPNTKYISGSGSFTAASVGSLSNAIAISFPQSLLTWGTITYVGFYDAATPGTGNLLYFGALSPSRIIQAGTIVYFNAGDIVVSIVNA